MGPAARIESTTTAIAAADVVVNLAGASIGDKRLTGEYQKVVLAVARRLDHDHRQGDRERQPRGALLQGSSMGFYGDRGDRCR